MVTPLIYRELWILLEVDVIYTSKSSVLIRIYTLRKNRNINVSVSALIGLLHTKCSYKHAITTKKQVVHNGQHIGHAYFWTLRYDGLFPGNCILKVTSD